MKKKHRSRSVRSLENVTLGLDLGSNSIGWALVDQGNEKIIAAGSRIFPEGVDRDKQGGELSKNESRRVARGMRRQIRRRARRKRQLREALVAIGLLPADVVEQAKLDALNPYELRRRALDQKITPHEFGRVLIHLNQRRGFLSNRKTDKDKKEASDMLAEISELAKQQEEAGHRTIGEHFAAKYAANPFERLRGKHTRRDMFLIEFETLWTQQAKHYPDLLTNELKLGTEGAVAYPRKPVQSAGGTAELLRRFGLFGIIFFQRPMYWPKSVVGKCELNPKEKRCPRADRAAQKFRIFQEVNNLKIIDGGGEIIDLTPDQRKKLVAYLGKSKEVSFDQIRKKLKLLEGVGFNLEAGKRKGLLGMTTDAILAGKKAYGEEWHELPESLKDNIVRSLIHDDAEVFIERARVEWKIERELAKSLLNVNLPDGYASLGRETIERLLPFIEKGIPLMTRDSAPFILAGFLAPWERTIKTGQFLPEPPDLTNPIVRQALYEVRKLINAIVREYGRPSAIHIEMAREIKGSAIRREEMSREMREREARRDHAKGEIEKQGFKATRETIDMYLLWEEQKKSCMYSGKSIGIAKLFGGDVAIDHILPYSRSLDDSLMNKVICLRDENDAKGQRTPYEWLAAQNPQKYEQVLLRAAKDLPIEIRNRKRPRFAQKTCELNHFINRQLTDTAYITSAVVDYVKGLGVQVHGTKGQLTAELRHQWGLNDVLRDDGLNLKNREDHRHHAIDAIIVAFTDPSRLQELARARGFGKEMKRPWGSFRKDVETVVNSINVSHRVRRKVAGALHNDMLFGQVKLPSAIQVESTSNEAVYVKRKRVEALDNTKQLRKVRVPAIREALCDYLREQGIDPTKPQKLTPLSWRKQPKMRSGVPIIRVRLVERGDSFAEVRPGAFVELASNHHVEIFELVDSKGVAINDKHGNTKRVGRVITMMQVAQAITNAQKAFAPKRQEILNNSQISRIEKASRLQIAMSETSKQFPVISRNFGADRRFVMSLAINEMILLQLDDGSESLHRVQKVSEGAIVLRPHTYAGKCSDTDKPPIIQRRVPNTLRGRKVLVDLLGRIRWAND